MIRENIQVAKDFIIETGYKEDSNLSISQAAILMSRFLSIKLKEDSWNKDNPTKEGSYLCFMVNGYIKMCYYNGEFWLDMWKNKLEGEVDCWKNLPEHP